MKVTYDADRDGLRIVFSDAPIEQTNDAAAPGLVLDLDADGRVVGLEVTEASRRMKNPRVVEFSERRSADPPAISEEMPVPV